MANSATTPASATLSPTSLRDSLYSASTVSPEVTTVTKAIDEMKGSLGNMGTMLDAIGKSTINMIQKGGEMETAKHINGIKKALAKQDAKVESQIEDIKVLFKETLEHDVIEHLKMLVEAGVMEKIDEQVKEQVAAQLPSYFPKEVQDELDRHMRELDDVQRALYNSESRRANAQLRSSHPKDPLHKIYKSDGTISACFPKDIHSLFNMDADTAKQLMEDYGLDVSDSREKNVNQFMQFCGVTYQLVMTKGGEHLVLKRTKAAVYD